MTENSEIKKQTLNLKRINWLASYPKSGNTWVRFLLTAYFRGQIDINEDANHIVSDTMIQPYQASSCVPLHLLSEEGVMLLRNAALLQLIAWSSESRVMVKTHSANLILNHSIRLIPPEFTNSAIYIIRDPRDVAISFAHHVGESIDDTITAMEDENCSIPYDDSNTIQYLHSWSSNVISWMAIRENNVFPLLFVRYEDLINDTANQLRKILIHFGYSNIDEQRLHKTVDICKFSSLQLQEQRNGFKEAHGGRQFFRNGSTQQWQYVLTKKQIQRIESAHSSVMMEFAYEKQSRSQSRSQKPQATQVLS